MLIGSFSQIGIVIFVRSFPIADFIICQTLKLYPSGIKAGSLSLISIVYVIGIPPKPIIVFEFYARDLETTNVF
jgi:hypothetical protein